MPELPEVETTRRGIEPAINLQTIASVSVRNAKLRWPVNPDLAQRLVGQQVKSVHRRAKYLIIQLERGILLIHLGMSGHLRVLKPAPAPEKHDHVDITFGNGVVLRYNDPRRFGAVLWHPENQHPLLEKLGPEPLSEAFSVDQLYTLSRRSSQPIKTFIMDQQIVVGVGNIYACEALFKARINPKRTANKVSKARYEKLVVAIKETLAKAIEQGGTTLRDFKQAEGKPGYFAQQLTTYGRAGQPCNHCGSTIKTIKQAQRSTFYCPQCQR